ncbi:AMP-binding enzyme family protein [Paecilomyces variotii No. 5]|uniref:AMP-binding enzyme family protein n=1 Tax=Byssochlamys spectabilis (strain No. 5 / NBRC 109023) TaxID=1356009 RepID=V5FYI8_BYSSN|nr:AMP-binding enzyme family protein [Paecilomyces variotii No. 5]
MGRDTATGRRIIAQSKDERQREPADDLVTVFDQVAQQHPDRTAVLSLHQKDHLGIGSLRWTYSQLRDGSIRLAHRLAAAGLRQGNRIATFFYNEIEWAILFLASARLGCHFVPLDPRTLNQPADAVYLLRKVWAESIFVSNVDLANQIEHILETELMPQIRIKCALSPSVVGETDGNLPRGWTTLAALMTGPTSTTNSFAPLNRDDTILMLCTSGTTSRPKVCPHTSVTIVTPALGLADHWSINQESTLCQHLPSFHIFSVAFILTFWVSGGTVVFPSPEFNPAASFEALASGPKVYMACVPTMVYAMHTLSTTTNSKFSSPFGICLGGAPITPDVLHTCKALGAKQIIAGYGTTEGVATLFNPMDVNDPRITNAGDGDDVCLGTAKAGSHLRVCAPGSRKPLRCGEIGELHQGGYPVFDGYFEGSEEDNSTCYREGTVPWFATGDRGYMDEEGCIYLLGRYKDLIIRGGENISPLKIEQCLCGQPGVKSAVVVGAPDDIAGEVPVAVIETRDNKSKEFFNELQSAVVRALGRSFAPKLILHLQRDLGREKYPTTTSGKIKKNIIKEWVATHIGKDGTQKPSSQASGARSVSDITTANIPSTIETPTGTNISEELTACWSAISGVEPEQIKSDMPIRTFTDSTMQIQFLNLAKKKGWKLTLKDLLAADTVQKQAQLLVKKGTPYVSVPISPQSTTSAIVVDIKKEMVASQLGVDADDIEELVPMTDILGIMAFNRPFPGAWDFRVPFVVRRPMNADQLVAVLETWLRRHELLRSMVATVDNDRPVYAVMHPRESWLRKQITCGPGVTGREILKSYDLPDYLDSSAGPLCKLTVVPMLGTDLWTFVLHMHHVIFDGALLGRWFQDLDHLLDGKPLLTWQPYRHFAAAYDAYRSTPEAEESVDFYVRRLQGISVAKDAILPFGRPIAKGHMVYLGRLHEKGVIGPGHEGYTRTVVSSEVRLPRLAEMRSSFGISAPIIAMAACALVNVRYSGAPEAIFLNLQSGRSWPLEADTSNAPSSTMEIDGPAFTNPASRISVALNETALELLASIRADQDNMMVYGHTPINRVFDKLAQTETGTADIAMVRDLFHGQIFDWLLEPISGNPDQALEMGEPTHLSPTTWSWMPYLKEGNVMHLDLNHMYPDLPDEEAESVVEEFLCAAAWLADPENALKPISQCRYEGYEVAPIETEQQ